MARELHKRRMSGAGERRMGLLSSALVVGALACSSSRAGSGDGATSGGGASGANGGAGNPAPQAGRANDGGALSADGGRASSTAGSPSADCPSWPLGRLFPLIGPFFYGPDPGPCRLSDGSSQFSYAGGQVQTATETTGNGTVTYTWQADRLISSMDSRSADSYAYSPGSVVIASRLDGASDQTQTYRLDAQGYPLSVDVESSGGPPRWFRYDYIDCRLDQRVETDDNGNPLSTPASDTFSYTYDAQGHVLARGREGYDYSCWQSASDGTGGASTNGNAGSGGSAIDSTVGCPAWPANKLVVLLGALFYGPDPGPCSWTDGERTKTFSYADGRLQSITNSEGGSETLNWDGARVATSVETNAQGLSLTTTYGYSADTLTMTTTNASASSASTTTYHLSPAGYPLSRDSVETRNTSPPSTGPVTTTTYQYDHCLLSGSQFGYDAAGHLLGALPMSVDRFGSYAGQALDYRCWRH